MVSNSLNPTEKYQSQIPALQFLVNLGFIPLSQKQTNKLRDQKLSQVLLEDILEERLLKLNHFTVKGQNYPCDIEDAMEAIRKLKPSPDQMKGLRITNQDLYDLLILGTTIRKTINGDTKSYSFRYIDWNNPENNHFHVTAEFKVTRTGSEKTCRCDIICFVNGIPFIIIENKEPTIPLTKAASQLINYQSEEYTPHLFHYSQLLLTMNRVEARYATVGSSKQYWHTWNEEFDQDPMIEKLINKPLDEEQKEAIFSGDIAQFYVFLLQIQ